MIDAICLDANYSTTRLLTQKKPKIVNSSEDKFKTVLFLQEGEERKGEGGLRTKGYFKQSYDDKPLISIITVVFNGEKYLEKTIQSVINQNCDNTEYIIIDGASTDGTIDIIKKYEDQIDYWVSEKDDGIYDAMNKGLDLVSGEWVNFMNADDKFYDIDVLKNISYVLLDNIGKKYLLIYGNVLYNKGLFVKSKFSFKTYLHNTIHHQSAFYSRKLFRDFRYDINYKISADYELNLLLCKYHKKDTLYLDNAIALCEDDGISRKNYKESHTEMVSIRQKYFNKFINFTLNRISGFKFYLHMFIKRFFL